ncbi:hypothetical protein ACWEV4_33305, partial [Streptomyces sp. NPDC003860]
LHHPHHQPLELARRRGVHRLPVGALVVLGEGAGYGLLMLTVADDGRSASGAFVGRVAFMWLRAERPGSWPDVQEIPRTRPSEIDPALVAQDIDVQFAVGLRMPDVAHRWAVDSGGRYETLRLRVWDDRGSRAVAFCSGPRTVYEAGPRSLWKEVEEAHLWWTLAGRPACEDFRIAVDAAGSHRVWTGTDPERGWALLDPFTGLRPLPA